MLPAHLRASDADRQRVVEQLQRHFSEGRLSPDELRERVSLAMTARTHGDLAPIQHDLPVLDAPSVAASPHYEAAFSPVPTHNGLRVHVLMYLLIMTSLVVVWLLTTPGGYFWPVWPMLGWGIGVGAHIIAATSKTTPTRRRQRERIRQ